MSTMSNIKPFIYVVDVTVLTAQQIRMKPKAIKVNSRTILIVVKKKLSR